MRCLDAHVHCGIQDKSELQTFEDYIRYISGGPVNGAVFFPPVIEIYDRWDLAFVDTPAWQNRRRQANEYLLGLDAENFDVFAYLFVWNDFAVQDLDRPYRGIKWHRHAGEPQYHYDDPRCMTAIDEIRERNMPVVFEEILPHTLRFVRELAVGVTVIIPHMGFLNGGYRALLEVGLFDAPNVYVDTSLASIGEILDYLNRYGEERVLFGSDFPYGDPFMELEKIMRLPISSDKKEAIAGLNLERLMSQSNG